MFDLLNNLRATSRVGSSEKWRIDDNTPKEAYEALLGETWWLETHKSGTSEMEDSASFLLTYHAANNVSSTIASLNQTSKTKRLRKPTPVSKKTRPVTAVHLKHEPWNKPYNHLKFCRGVQRTNTRYRKQRMADDDAPTYKYTKAYRHR